MQDKVTKFTSVELNLITIPDPTGIVMRSANFISICRIVLRRKEIKMCTSHARSDAVPSAQQCSGKCSTPFLALDIRSFGLQSLLERLSFRINIWMELCMQTLRLQQPQYIVLAASQLKSTPVKTQHLCS
jgi:hypothetical protein